GRGAGVVNQWTVGRGGDPLPRPVHHPHAGTNAGKDVSLVAAVVTETVRPHSHDPEELSGLTRREATERLLALMVTASEDERRALQDQVIQVNMQIAVDVARRYRSRGVAAEDLEQVAYVGLVKAARGFDP